MDQRKLNDFLMRTVAVLLMLVLLSTSMVTGRYARYVSSANSGDSARVAKFDVTVADTYGQTVPVLIQPGETAEKLFTVENKSEVAVALEYKVTNKYSNLPLEFQYTVSDSVGPGKTVEVPVKITWPKEKCDDQYIGMVDLLEISVRVVQVD